MAKKMMISASPVLQKEAYKMRLIGVTRDAENDQVLMLSFSRRPSDEELRRLHEQIGVVVARVGEEPMTDVQRSIRDGSFGVKSVN